jgi:uncharacterized protein YbjT (DUF2867 family)
MNVPAASQKRLVIVGATGMVGGYALRYALDHPTVGRVTAIGRRNLGVSHPKLDEVLHRDFADCSALAETLSGRDAAIFCLGTYTGSVSDAEFRKVTVDYTVEFARVLHGSSLDAAFSFLSGNGADPTGRAVYPAFRMLFPNQVIPADDLARAMVDVAVRERAEREARIFENREIRAMVKS